MVAGFNRAVLARVCFIFEDINISINFNFFKMKRNGRPVLWQSVSVRAQTNPCCTASQR